MIRFSLFLAALFALVLFALTQPAHAGFEGIEQTIVVASGTTNTLATIPMKNVKIIDAVAWVPTLDADDTGTITLRAVAFSSTYTPVGWSDVAIGATSDNAIVKLFSTLASIISSESIQVRCWTSSAQAADRTFKIRFLTEN